MERQIEKEMEKELPKRPPTPFRPRTFKVSDIKEERPDRAMDQLALAISGLLKAEEQLRQLAQDIVGEIAHDDEAERNSVPADKGPLIPRLRSDAELMARLAIRLVKLCEEVRGKL